MKILDVIFPVVVDDFAAYADTIAQYRTALDLRVKATFSHAGFTVTWLGPMVVLGAEDARALAIPRQVNGIFVVDDLEAFWSKLEPTTEVLVTPDVVPTGRRFVVRHKSADRRVIEYLELATSR
jgi:hypothetical protein